ncbi:hypothetical protein SETIT_2G408700v2 [Setaria italica]|uniref:Uncharacterized protein n=1 Tax=Setaria italica TaxID=4555 RepID=A0A368Q889_SETIT|nr:hypothetical protein SETIT_2G408700v2 [Setaria italica]
MEHDPEELDGDDPIAAARRYARMDERGTGRPRALRYVFVASRKIAPGRCVSFRLVGGKLVRETETQGQQQEVPANGGGVGGEPPSSR